jgi:RNA polymerase sigma factor (sigma-70 family)
MRPEPDLSTSPSLLGRLGAGTDAVAWDEFVRRYGGLIDRWCRRWRLQDADASDVSQDILLRVAKQMRAFRYDPGRSFRGWLRTVAHGAWCDWVADQRAPGRGTGDDTDLLAAVEARDDLVKRIEEEYDCELLEAATALVRLRVEPQTWQAFQFQAIDGLSGAEAAERLGVSVGTAFVAKSRVHKMLRDTVGKLEAAGPGGC